MSTVTFDTLKASRHLQAVGVAEAIVGSMAGAFSDTVASKADSAALEAEIFRALWIQGAGIVGLTKLL